jgi:hypothetical protein
MHLGVFVHIQYVRKAGVKHVERILKACIHTYIHTYIHTKIFRSKLTDMRRNLINMQAVVQQAQSRRRGTSSMYMRKFIQDKHTYKTTYTKAFTLSVILKLMQEVLCP